MLVQIWILDDDISFAYEVKKLVKDVLARKVNQNKFDVFHDLQGLCDAWIEVKKKKKPQPDLCILEIVIDKKSILFDLPPDLFDLCKILICSSASYGGYHHLCEQEKWQEQKFIEKSQLEYKLKPFLEDFLKESNVDNIAERFSAGLKIVKIIEENYYNTKDSELSMNSVFNEAQKLFPHIEKLGDKNLIKPLRNFLSIKEEPNLKIVRFKKILREFIMAINAFKIKYQLD